MRSMLEIPLKLCRLQTSDRVSIKQEQMVTEMKCFWDACGIVVSTLIALLGPKPGSRLGRIAAT